VVNRMYRHPWGLHRIQNLWIYVNQGTGYWGPPLRLGTRSELATLRVVGVSSSDSSPCSRQPCLPP
jgi:predicted MPP superfamily phosphohydrolase